MEHILVVEDHDVSRDMLISKLSREGFLVSGLPDGRQCANFIAEQEPNLVLLDISLPFVSGIEVLETLRNRWSREQLPVICVTAHVDTDDVVDALNRGANDYVVKPICFPVLLARIQAQLLLQKSVRTVLKMEKQRVMMESLGAACHHLAQPMTAILGTLDLLTERKESQGSVTSDDLKRILKWAREVAAVIHKLQSTRDYNVDDYLGDIRVVSIQDDVTIQAAKSQA